MKKEEIRLFILKEENQMINYCHQVQYFDFYMKIKKEKFFKWGAVWKYGENKIYKC